MAKPERVAPPVACPCGSGQPYAYCCGPLHDGQPAASAEALMRSRYSAYVLRLDAYLLSSWHPSTRPTALDAGADADGVATKWLGLDIRRRQTTAADRATVEFVARCRIGSRARRLHEISRFVREDGRWYYLDGEFPDAA